MAPARKTISMVIYNNLRKQFDMAEKDRRSLATYNQTLKTQLQDMLDNRSKDAMAHFEHEERVQRELEAANERCLVSDGLLVTEREAHALQAEAYREEVRRQSATISRQAEIIARYENAFRAISAIRAVVDPEADNSE